METLHKGIIVAWIGKNDTDAMNAWRVVQGLEPSDPKFVMGKRDGIERKGYNGAIRTLTDELKADIVYLLVSREYSKQANMVREWVKRGTTARCEIIQTDVDDPSSYDEVYRAAEEFFCKHWNNENASLFNFNLTPGTPAMQAIMLYLSQIRYVGGKAWRVIDPRYAKNGVQHFEVRLPFRLPVEVWARQSPALLANEPLLQEVLRVYAPVPSVNILLLGESGVGKTYFARQIHEANGGKDENFVEVNCAELSAGDPNMFRAALFGYKRGAYTGAVKDEKGAFEKAKDGTLFLDEIGEIPRDSQAILLRAIQSREFDVLGGGSKRIESVRIIAATNRNLVDEVCAGRFRSDLYYRIAMLPVKLPSLRAIRQENPENFEKIINGILKDLGTDAPELAWKWHLDGQAWSVLNEHSWPGNIRELRHVLLLACVSARAEQRTLISADDVERHLAQIRPLAERLAQREGTGAGPTSGIANSTLKSFETQTAEISESEDFIPSVLKLWLKDREKEFILRALKKTGYNYSKAGKLLGITYQQMYYVLKKDPEYFGISLDSLGKDREADR